MDGLFLPVTRLACLPPRQPGPSSQRSIKIHRRRWVPACIIHVRNTTHAHTKESEKKMVKGKGKGVSLPPVRSRQSPVRARAARFGARATAAAAAAGVPVASCDLVPENIPGPSSLCSTCLLCLPVAMMRSPTFFFSPGNLSLVSAEAPLGRTNPWAVRKICYFVLHLLRQASYA